MGVFYENTTVYDGKVIENVEHEPGDLPIFLHHSTYEDREVCKPFLYTIDFLILHSMSIGHT